MEQSPRCTNITAAGARRRRTWGWAALLGGVAVAAWLARRGAPPAAYLLVFPFAFSAAFGLLQARSRTCVVLGFSGSEEVEGGGVRPVADDATRAQARRQAKEVLWTVFAIATVATVAAMLAGGVAATP